MIHDMTAYPTQKPGIAQIRRNESHTTVDFVLNWLA